MFIQLTSVSVPHDLKFSTVPRAKSDPKSISYHSLGEKFPQNRIIFDRSEKKSESVQCMRKSGVLTFMVNKPVILYGVNIIVDKARSSRISLSVFRKDETIKQISSKSFVTKPSRSEECGEIEVFFNRSLPLTKDTCYTIETQLVGLISGIFTEIWVSFVVKFSILLLFWTLYRKRTNECWLQGRDNSDLVYKVIK